MKPKVAAQDGEWLNVYSPTTRSSAAQFVAEVIAAMLLHVATTPATHELVLTSSRGSRFSERVKALCAQ